MNVESAIALSLLPSARRSKIIAQAAWGDRRVRVAPLEVFAATPHRNSAILKACARGKYSHNEIVQAFGIYGATVHRIVKVKRSSSTTPP
jgi:hypothetical protein